MSLTPPSIRIIEAVEVTEELFQACHRLIPQMTHNNPPPTRLELEQLLGSGSSTLFLAVDQQPEGEMIIGLATLTIYRVPTGLRGYIEDVVVDESQRGKRIGELLTTACLDKARSAGCPQVMLTCNPARIAANRLYQRMGFELRKTNVYRYAFPGNKVPGNDRLEE